MIGQQGGSSGVQSLVPASVASDPHSGWEKHTQLEEAMQASLHSGSEKQDSNFLRGNKKLFPRLCGDSPIPVFGSPGLKGRS